MKKRKAAKKEEFEFCAVCKLNHDQGRRHNFFPNHAKSLSSLLSRFLAKISDVRFFLNNPSPLRPEHASRNRIWCVVCDLDIHELKSSVACSNAIKHLASVEHLKSLKQFLWKYGGGMDRVDTLRISEEDLAKWEKKCAALKAEIGTATGKSRKNLCGPSNDIHNRPNNENIQNFDSDTVYFNNSNLSNGVTPLQHFTNESFQISESQCSGVANVGSFQHTGSSSLLVGTHSNGHLWSSNDMKDSTNVHDSMPTNGMKYPTDAYHTNTQLYQVRKDETMLKELSSYQGLQVVTQKSSVGMQGATGNVHSGAPPPWFNEVEIDLQSKLGGSLVSSKAVKSQKLNPKRVGAAWAEKRKIELEMEKCGEIVENRFSDDWLPNFGRVWQSGSRKDSRREFELDKQKLQKAEAQANIPIKIQPYISKRMIKDTSLES